MKILVIRFSSIGDIVLTTPIIRCLKKQLPAGTEIHFLTKPSFASLLQSNPYIDKLWLLNKNESETIDQLKIQAFDRIIDLHHNLRTLKIKWRLGVKSSAFRKLNFQKFLLTQFKINRMPKIHIVDRYFETVRELGVVNDYQGLDYFGQQTPSQLDDAVWNEQKWISMAIGGQHFTKRMPLQKICEIINGIQTKVVLLGGKEDIEVALAIEQKYPDKVLNLVGKLSLHESAGAVHLSSALITHDTGMMHIAAALKKTVLVIWGNTVPQLGMYPYYGSQSVPFYQFEVKDLSCRPCSKLGYNACPKGHFKCMNLQNTEAIVQTVDKV